MVATRAAARGLSTAELEHIRDTLAAGRKPKVVFTESAGQIAGQSGQVVGLMDPEVSEEWVLVRFGRDELPFSPADLVIAPKAAPARRSASSSVPVPREEPAVPAVSTVESKAAANGAGVSRAAAKPTEARAEPAKAEPTAKPAPGGAASGAAGRAARPAEAKGAPAGDARPAQEAVPDPTPDVSAMSTMSTISATSAAPAAAGRPAARKAAKPKAPAGLTVTLTYAEGEWTVAANQGAKALAKPYVIRPSEALKMVALLDVPGVHEAVEQIVSSARAEAESQAERLRAELAEIESRLAELREVG